MLNLMVEGPGSSDWGVTTNMVDIVKIRGPVLVMGEVLYILAGEDPQASINE